MPKVYIYCGNDIVSSRKAFLEHLEKFKEDFVVERIIGQDLDGEKLELFSSSTNLFSQKKVLAIENLITGPKKQERKKFFEKIKDLLDCHIIIWESREFTKAEKEKLPSDFVFKDFNFPSSLFLFLDSLSPKTEVNLSLFHQTLKEVDPTFIFLMLVRQFRYLILASENELHQMLPWQLKKLSRQAKIFQKDKLISTYSKLLEIDYKQKTSQTPNDLVYELDLFFAQL